MIRDQPRKAHRRPRVSRKTLLPRSSARRAGTLKASRRGSRVDEKRNGSLPADLPAESTPSFIEPMKCHLSNELPEGADWWYEIKLDGIRAIAIKNGEDVHLFSRTHNDLTTRFSAIAAAVRKLRCVSVVLDGEAVALDEAGRSSFQLLQSLNLPGAPAAPILYYAFDLLHLNGKNLRSFPLVDRQQILAKLLQNAPSPIRISAPLNASAEAVLKGVKQFGLEGVIAKRRDSAYQPGTRSCNWIKVKTVQQQEFVIGGYTRPEGARQFFGAVIVGYYERGKLLFASKVGSGFDTESLKSLYKKFQTMRRDGCPFVNLPEPPRQTRGGLTAREMRECSWIEPGLVCEIRFAEWTRDGHLRQPVFLGLREDKPPSDVGRERPASEEPNN